MQRRRPITAIVFVAGALFMGPAPSTARDSAVVTIEKTISRLQRESNSAVILDRDLPSRPKLWKNPEIDLPRKGEEFRTALRDVITLAVCESDREAVELLKTLVRALNTLIFTEAEAVFLDHRASELWINQIFVARTRSRLALIQNAAHRPKQAQDVQQALDEGKVDRALKKIPTFAELCPH